MSRFSGKEAKRPIVLFLCTANQCRSPAAAARFRLELTDHGLDAEVRSAGFLPPGGPVPKKGIEIGRRYCLELKGHRSATVDVHQIRAADLIIAMAREHAREAVALVPERRPRTFTLLQLNPWLASQYRPRDATLGNWLDEAGQGRPSTTLIGHREQEDVVDPMGRRGRAWVELFSLLDREVPTLVEHLRPFLRPGTNGQS